jgi:hypothetical protein
MVFGFEPEARPTALIIPFFRRFGIMGIKLYEQIGWMEKYFFIFKKG